MSFLFKPQYTYYTDPVTGKKCHSSTPGAIRHSGETRYWYGKWQNSSGQWQRPKKLHRVKAVAQKMLDKIDAEIGGLIERARDPLGPLLDEYLQYLAAKDNTEKHVAAISGHCAAIIAATGFRTPADITEAPVVSYLGSLRQTKKVDVPHQEFFTKNEIAKLLDDLTADGVAKKLERLGLEGQIDPNNRRRKIYPREVVLQLVQQMPRGLSVETTNHYLTAFKGFCVWLKRNRILPSNPLEGAEALNADADRRRQRRAESGESLEKLLAAAAQGKEAFGLSGPDRVVIYLIAIHTGLRASELGTLTPQWFSLDATPPTVKVQAGYSKRRREDTQPLRPDMAALLKEYLRDKPPDQPVWPGKWSAEAAEMLRGDLEKAGIPYQDERGRYFDFHSLRKTFVTTLVRAGVPAKVVQLLARHSDINLTMQTYTDSSMIDVGDALSHLPKMPPPPKADTER